MDTDMNGVFVDEVQKDTPAEKGGLKAGDVILELNGELMDNVDHFRFKVAENSPGSKVSMTIWRDGKRKSLNFTLGDRQEFLAAGSKGTVEQGEESWLGINVEDLSSTKAREWGIKATEGVLVVNLSNSSPAGDALQVRDVIIRIGKTDIHDLSDYRKVANDLKDSKDAILFRIRRGDRTSFVAVDPSLAEEPK
jgi:serine protease Do